MIVPKYVLQPLKDKKILKFEDTASLSYWQQISSSSFENTTPSWGAFGEALYLTKNTSLADYLAERNGMDVKTFGVNPNITLLTTDSIEFEECFDRMKRALHLDKSFNLKDLRESSTIFEIGTLLKTIIQDRGFSGVFDPKQEFELALYDSTKDVIPIGIRDMNTVPSTEVFVCVVFHDKKALILKRSENELFEPNFWDLPGGCVFETTNIVEIVEAQTGLELYEWSLKHVGDFMHNGWKIKAFNVDAKSKGALYNSGVTSLVQKLKQLPIDSQSNLRTYMDFRWITESQINDVYYVEPLNDVLHAAFKLKSQNV